MSPVLVALCMACLDGRLADQRADWTPQAALGVVMAAGGYPASYARGASIEGLPPTVIRRPGG